MNLSPVILFVYNRPWHTEQTLNALAQNTLANESVLTIYADGPKAGATEDDKINIAKVRSVIRSKKWCKQVNIVEADYNKGLAASIIEGVTNTVNKNETVIVLEDDIITSPGFLEYMNDALQVYRAEQSVMHISGYMYPLGYTTNDTRFLNVVTPWGWATWKSRWQHFNGNASDLMEKLLAAPHYSLKDYNKGYGNEFTRQLQANIEHRINTWAVKWHTSIYLKKGFCLHPSMSLVQNIGFDNSGIHCSTNEDYKVEVLAKEIKVVEMPLTETPETLQRFEEFYLKFNPPITKEKSLWDKVRSLFKGETTN